MCLTLTACSEDVYQEAEMQNEEAGSQYQTNSFNDNNSGIYWGNGGIREWGDNYISPWDVWYRGGSMNGIDNLQPSYFFSNGNAEDPSQYNIEVFAYIGLAYFDGDNDGVYNDPYLAYHTGNGFVANLNNGNYPNLYPNTIIPPSTTQQEVGHLIRVPMAINVDAYPATNYSFRIEDEINHLPVIGAANAVPKYPFPTFPYSGFDFAGSITQQEMDLLANYGKVFFYEVNVYDKNTGAFVMTTMMHPQIETLPTGSKPVPNWQPVTEGPLSAGNHLKGNVPTLGDFDLYYCNVGRPDGTYFDFYGPKNGNISDSREVVFDVPMPLHEVQIDPNHKIVLDIAATGQTAWLNSALYLYVTSR